MEWILAMRPLIAVCASVVCAALILVLGERVRPNVREALTFTAAGVKALCVFSMVPQVLAGAQFEITVLPLADGIDFALKVDSLGILFACVASGLWIVTSVYSVGYMRGHGEKNQTGYFAAFAMCLCGAVGVCFAANLLTFFVFYEILTVATYPLVVHYRDEKGKRAGRRYLIYTLTSGQLFFVGILITWFLCGTTDFAPGGFAAEGFAAEGMESGPAFFVFCLLVIGGAVKAGVMPLHSWLPGAMVAPTPVSALLHAVAVVKAGAFCVIRIVCYVFGPDFCRSLGIDTMLCWFAVTTIILASLIAMRKDNLKARLAYSTVGQLSYIVLGVGILTPASVTGAVYHIVAHAVMKITLFMCAGAIFVTTHKSEISQMRGLGRRMPVTMTAFTAASLGIAGLPMMAGFVSKMSILQGAAESGGLLYMAALIASALLSLTYLVPVSYIAFTGKNVNPDFAGYGAGKLREGSGEKQTGTARGCGRCRRRLLPEGEAASMMLIPLLFTALLSVALGIMPDFGAKLFSFAQEAARQIFEGGL